MKRAVAFLAMPFYAVAIGFEVCRLAYRMARLQADAKKWANESIGAKPKRSVVERWDVN
jgi:hypothetical protein